MKRRQRMKREKLRDENVLELRKLKDLMGLEVLKFSDIHFRIVGRNSIDYWPTRGTMWIVGTNQKGRKASVLEACEMAVGSIEIDPNLAMDSEFRAITQ